MLRPKVPFRSMLWLQIAQADSVSTFTILTSSASIGMTDIFPFAKPLSMMMALFSFEVPLPSLSIWMSWPVAKQGYHPPIIETRPRITCLLSSENPFFQEGVQANSLRIEFTFTMSSDWTLPLTSYLSAISFLFIVRCFLRVLEWASAGLLYSSIRLLTS